MDPVFSPQLNARQSLACLMLQTSCHRQALAPAYLITGRGGYDKRLLAQQLACHLNCQSLQVGGSCAARNLAQPECCQNCRWILQEAHPQAWIILSAADGGAGVISVEKARNLSLELSKTSSFKRVVVITSATQEVLHRPAANALLKTIEEPGEGCVFLLFAFSREDVLPTIVSRCQEIPMTAPKNSGLWLPEPEYHQLAQKAQPSMHPDSRSYWEGFAGVAKATATLVDALDWAEKLEELADSGDGLYLTIDAAIASEYQRFAGQAVNSSMLTAYLRKLLQLGEEAKEQIDRFVKPKNALEAFTLSCRKLCHGSYAEVVHGQS